MTKEKQIEEMARSICNCYYRGICKMDGNSCDLECGSAFNAYELYNAGYRKASEVAEDIIRMLRAAGINEWRYPIIAEIKKKYTGGE